MKNFRRVVWCVTALTVTPVVGLVLASCGDGGTGPTPSETFNPGQTPVRVSEPVAGGPVASSPVASPAPGLVEALDTRESAGLAYISYAPGSIPGADSIRVENLNRNEVIGARMVDGGLDPIAITANVGDSLSIDVFKGSTLLAEDYAIVPEKDPPTVVRSSPGRRQTRVPLNSTMHIVFSEPISPSSLNPETILLFNGTRLIPTMLSLSDGGLRVSLLPVEPLQPGITYTILITANLIDLSGSSIQEPFSAEFTTEYAAGTGSVLVSTTTVNNLDPDGLVLSVDGTESATLDPNGSLTIPTVPQGVRELMISGVAPNCTVEGLNPRSVSVSEGTTVTESFSVNCTDPPEGRILFHHGGDESTWISVMNVDGSGKIELRSIGSGEEAGRSEWSPDGRRIAFSDHNSQGGLEIFLMNKDGSGVVPLRADGDGDRWERAPSWSPSGGGILFESREGIWLTDRFGSEPEDVWKSFEPKMPEWSWDGENIAWASGSLGHLMYKILDRALTVIREGDHVCGGGGCVDDLPLWSPVDNRVLFRRARGGFSFPDGLWIWDFDVKSEYLLVEGAVWFDWSPDGSKIVYTDSEKIFVMNADGSGKTVIRDLSENYDQATETAYSRLSWGR